MKTQSKIALTLCLSNVLIVLLFGGAIYYLLYKYSYTDFYEQLEARANIEAKYYFETDRLNAETEKTLKEQHYEKLTEEQEFVVEINSEADLAPAAEKHKLPKSFFKKIWAEGKSNLQEGSLFYAGIKYAHENKTYLVVLSANNYFASHHLSFLRNIIFGGIIFTILITAYISIYLSKHIFDPIKQITDEVKQISTENIHKRLEEKDNNNEISELISTFNDLLVRIETAFETQKNFISNASHELGTPLTAIIGEADVALIKTRTQEEYREALQNISQQAERLDQITKSLLFLAQTGYEGKKITFEIFRTDEIIWEVKKVIDKLNPHNKIFIDLALLPEDPKKLKIKGNKQLLHLAIANILNNACKYSHNKPVSVSIAASNNQVIVIIKDQGVGIPEHELQYIYDPFFRASNTHFFEGYGIGLPLARNIILLHKGTLTVSSAKNEGTTVQINFPLFHVA
ncbi:MAG: HAMP domain-containing histidine kinase [Bacteroidetes bacterium]|nr:HAMP domain-containing histidine kinase [Bacteroidota bacterium]